MATEVGNIIGQVGTGTYRLVKGKDVDITNATDGTSITIADADLFLIDDAAAGTQASTKKITGAQLKTYIAAPTTAEAHAYVEANALALTAALTTNSTIDGRDVATDGTKLDGIEASADVTDTTNVTSSGALMDSEVTNLAQVKAFDTTDYATSTQGTTADNALPKAGGTMTGQLILDGNPTLASGDGTKLHIDGSTPTVSDATGTVAMYSTVNIERDTISATNGSVVITDSASLYVAGPPRAAVSGTYPSLTNAYALWVDAGEVRFDGALITNSTIDGVDIATRDGVLTSTTTTANAALPKAGGTMSGDILLDGNRLQSIGRLDFNTGVSILGMLDEDAMTSNSATYTATQQSIKAYVDNEVKYQYETKIANYYSTVATNSHIPIIGYIVERTSTLNFGEYISMIAPFNGTIEKIFWRSEEAQVGAGRITINEATDGTEVPTTTSGRWDFNFSPTTDDTTHEFDLSTLTPALGDNILTKGNVYSIGFDPAAIPYDTYCTVVFKWDVTT
jgi:hypothetical protein